MKQLLFILLLWSGITQAQLFTKSDIPKMSLCLVAGAADGYNQAILFHYDTWKDYHPNANDQYWNPYISWENKYKDASNGDFSPAYFGSKTFLVFTTDAYHMTRMIDHTSMLTAVVLSGVTNRDEWWWYVVDFVKYFIARSIGFAITYKLIYR